MLNWPASLPQPDGSSYSWTEKPRIRRLNFGDGYHQRSRDNLNTNLRQWSLSWTNLKASDQSAMTAFLAARAGVELFFWTPPKETAPVTVKATNWKLSKTYGGCWSLAVEFFEVVEYTGAATLYLLALADAPAGVDDVLLLAGDQQSGTDGLIV